MKKITKESLLGIYIPIPPIHEQKKIAEILSTWDNAIESIESLIKAKEKLKKGLMQQLLTGKRRLPEYKSSWNEVRLGTVFRERNESGHNGLQLLSVTQDRGVIPQAETARKDSSNADKSKYKRICNGDIGYNTMRMWQGRSALSYLEGIISPAYTVCTPLAVRIEPEYAKHLFKLPKMIHTFYRHSQGLTSDTWNLKYSHFREIKVVLPTIEEQRKISTILNTCDEELELLIRAIESLKNQKKGLMQKLLTGELRVRV